MGLPQVIFAVMLLSSLLGVSVSYLSTTGIHERRMADTLMSGFDALAQGWHAYRRDHQQWGCVIDAPAARCPAYTRVENGVLPVEGWRDTLFGPYMFEPRFPANFTLSYLSTASGDAFCVTGAGNPTLLGAAQRFQADAAINQAIIDADCGVRQQGDLPAAESEWAITYWVNAR